MPSIMKASPRGGTLRKLIEIHTETLRRIHGGERFTKDGADVTQKVREAAEGELVQIRHVQNALQHMSDGEFQKAMQMLGDIEELLPNGERAN